MTIKEWLNSDRNFAIGVALYNAFGTDPLLKEMFGQGHSAIRETKLSEQLLQLKNMDQVTPVQDPGQPHFEPVQVQAISMPENCVQETKDPLRSEWLPLYQEMNLLRHTLESAGNDQERGKMAFRVLSLEQQCMAIWARRDYELRTGRPLPVDPDQQPAPFVDQNALYKKIQTLRTYISRYSKPSDNPKWPLHLERYKKELEVLMKYYNP